MAIKIEKKIVGYAIGTPEAVDPIELNQDESVTKIIKMDESVERPEEGLEGSTYKIKTPMFEHALYVTINDIVLNKGTKYEQRRPFEIFINSKNMDHFQWIVALTRIMSAVFRKGGDCTFLVEELEAVFDPRGGYFKKGGVFVPSLVAEIGQVLKQHLVKTGLMKALQLDEHQKQLIADKKAQLTAANQDGPSDSGFPESAVLCNKCSTKAMVLLDGCETCLNCGHSKCG